MRTTNADLDRCSGNLNRIVNGFDSTPDGTKQQDREFYISWAYGQPRLERIRGAGSEDVSPRLRSGLLLDWMQAFAKGVWEGRNAHRYLSEERRNVYMGVTV